MNNSIGLIESKGLVALIEAADVILKNSPIKILGVRKLENGLVSLSVFGESEYVKAAVESAIDAGRRVGEIYAYSVVENPDDELLNIIYELFDLGKGKVSGSKKESGNAKLKEIDHEIIKVEEKPVTEHPIVNEQKVRAIKKEKLKRKKVLNDKPPIIIKDENKHENENYNDQKSFSEKTLSTIERLRKEALGLSVNDSENKNPVTNKKKNEKAEKNYSNSRIDFEAIEGMNVHKLRHYARGFEDFPIKGRQISRANRDELVDLFKTMG